MTDRLVSAIVASVAIAAAAFVDVNGSDPSPYISVATLAFGYGVGKHIGKRAGAKSSTSG